MLLCLALSWRCPLAPRSARRDVLSCLGCRATLSCPSCCGTCSAVRWRHTHAHTHAHMHTSWASLAGPVPKTLCGRSSRASVGVSFLSGCSVSSGVLGAGDLPLLFWTKGTKPLSPSPSVVHLVVNLGHLNKLDLNQ